MNEQKLISDWKKEESVAHIHGWDFSHIAGRYTEEMDLPWDYQRIILDYLMPEMKLLDVDTGGGEFLLSLHHPHENTSAAEAYPPNVELCKETLLPLGIDFRVGDGEDILPYEDAAFDMVINRHGDFNVKDIHRMLKDGGIFITEQVGALVWFARIIEWEFPGFSVDCCKDRLLHAQELLEQNGVIEGRIHRFLLVCSKSKIRK